MLIDVVYVRSFADTCDIGSVVGLVLGIFLCIGSTCTYIPQFYVIFKSKTVKGLNEFSIILLNVGNFCLALNSIIFNWYKWSCFDKCNFWICNTYLLPFYQIATGWVMGFVFYVIFMKYKIKNTENKIIGAIFYLLLYFGFIAIAIIISVTEKLGNSGESRDAFFVVFGQIMGYTSAVCNAIVWIPQIYTMIKTKKRGNVSPIMFALQTPGNLIIIIFQAVLYKQPVSTWITYVICCTEQTVILIIMLVYWIRDKRLNDNDTNSNLSLMSDDDFEYDEEEEKEEYTGEEMNMIV